MQVFKLERWGLDEKISIKMINVDSLNIEEEDKLNKWKLRIIFI